MLFCAAMKKMDSYKAKVIKSHEVVDSGAAVPLSRVVGDVDGSESGSSAENESSKSRKTPLEKLHSEFEQRLIKAREEAYRQGFFEGVESQKKELFLTMQSLAGLIKSVTNLRKDVLSKTEEQIVKLACGIAEKIINQEVATRRDVVLSVIKAALKNISDTDGMKIRINPQDFRYLMEMKKDFLQSFDGMRNIVFEEDVAVKRGGAVVETMFGEVDARLESQLKEIKAAMLQG